MCFTSAHSVCVAFQGFKSKTLLNNSSMVGYLLKMRNHLEKISCRVFCVIAAVMLLWTPVSYFVYTGVQFPLPIWVGTNFSCVSGVAKVTTLERTPADWPMRYSFSFGWSRISTLGNTYPASIATTMMLHPASFQCGRTVARGGSYAATYVALPMWVIALAFLVWPTLYFVFNYRRPKNSGFPITSVST
jgi:hypothetical protein